MSARARNVLLRGMLCLMVVAAAGIAQAQPATLRLGYGSAAEEPLWLLLAKPDLAKNYGKAYTLEGTRFTGSDKRAQAFEAGAIDLASGSANGVIFGAAEGVHGQDDRLDLAGKLARFQHDVLRQGELLDQIGVRSQGQDRRDQRLFHVGASCG